MKALTDLNGRLLLKQTVGPSLIFDSDDYMYIFQFESQNDNVNIMRNDSFYNSVKNNH
jgi:hypothetical protein